MAIFIDANIPIYASGRAHPLREPCIEVMNLVATSQAAFVTSAEVLQELVHRYIALRSWESGRTVVANFAELMHGRVEPLTVSDVQHAAAAAGQSVGLSARDLVHAAVMHRIGATEVVSADRGFERLPNLNRLDPQDLATWRWRVQ